jgi:hypothetical protein
MRLNPAQFLRRQQFKNPVSPDRIRMLANPAWPLLGCAILGSSFFVHDHALALLLACRSGLTRAGLVQ